MELTNTFTVATPIDEMWPILCDIERIAPCMPGAQLTEVEGEEYRGEVKIKVGPISARFKGTATMVERDDGAHRAVLKASGKDTGGKGNANATITATAAATPGGGTEVTIATDLSITGKVAQFGRSAMADISTKLLSQFVDCLESRVLAGPGPEAASVPSEASASGPATAPSGPAPDGGPEPTTEATAPAPTDVAVDPVVAADADAAVDPQPAAGSAAAGARRIDGPEAQPIDLLDAAGAPVAKRVAPVVAALMAVFFVLQWRRRRRA